MEHDLPAPSPRDSIQSILGALVELQEANDQQLAPFTGDLVQIDETLQYIVETL